MSRLLLLNVLFFVLLKLSAQSYEAGYFRSPLDIDLKLAGNFGELRSNHFHSGLDIKTQNKEGLNIYAVADGYVSRIKVSPYGYGKVMYVTHPNGYVSVYAHLKRFNDTIGEFVKQEQYRQENFAIELFPSKGQLRVKKGDVIAISGNSGGSSGPHLHFEIREETEKAINPLLWGYNIPDKQKPVISEVAIYPLDINSRVNRQGKTVFVKVNTVNGIARALTDTVFAFGKIGIGLEGYDTEDGSTNKNGIYSIELKINGKKVYYHEFEKFGFDETCYINCHTDYPSKLLNKKNIQRSFLLKNNKLSIYKDALDRGILTVEEDSVYKIQYKASDYKGNTANLTFYLKGIPSNSITAEQTKVKHDAVFHYGDTNRFTTSDVSLILPPDILYEDLRFTYKSVKTPAKGTIGAMHCIHNDLTPLHSYYTLSLRCPELPENLKEKAFIVCIKKDGKRMNEGGEWKNGFITTQTKSFGNFSIALDTTPPVIKPENIVNNKVITGQKTISFKITDDLTGIKEYRGTIDGHWVIFEFDAKSNRLFYEKEKLSKGKHRLVLEVKDSRKNTATYSVDLIE